MAFNFCKNCGSHNSYNIKEAKRVYERWDSNKRLSKSFDLIYHNASFKIDINLSIKEVFSKDIY